MLVKVSSLGELFIALIVGAREGSLSGMHAQVVEEVMPLSELFVAIASIGASLDGAHQDFDHPFGKWIFGRKNEEVFSLWNVLQVLDLVVKVFEIELTTRGNLDHDRLRGQRYAIELLDLANREVVQKFFEYSEFTDRCLERDVDSSSYFFETFVLLILVRDTTKFKLRRGLVVRAHNPKRIS